MISKTFFGLACFMLFQLITIISGQNGSINPSKRGGHTATLIDGKLYILGGYNIPSGIHDEIPGHQFFYLDVSTPFFAPNIRWMDLTQVNVVPPHRRAAAVRAGENNKTLVLFGGQPVYNDTTMAIVYTFDTEKLSWSIPKVTDPPLNKSSLIPIVHNKKMYLFGGFIYSKYEPINFVSDMAILDTVSFRFTQGSRINAPTPRGYFGAVLLPTQKIIYIGKEKVFFFKK